MYAFGLFALKPFLKYTSICIAEFPLEKGAFGRDIMFYHVLEGENWCSDVWELHKQFVILVFTCDCDTKMRNRCPCYPKWNRLVGLRINKYLFLRSTRIECDCRKYASNRGCDTSAMVKFH